MGRNVPSNDVTTIHPVFSLAILVTWIAALVATISSLCGIWSKKNTKVPLEDENKNTRITTDVTIETKNSPLFTTSTDDNNNTPTMNDDGLTKPLPPPPAATTLEYGEIAGNKMYNHQQPSKIEKSSSLQNYISTRRKLSASLSMRMSMKIKDKASDFKDKASETIKGKTTDISHRKAKHDSESLWTKRIILGEKCRLPNENNDEVISDDDEHGAILDGHSRALSRSVSNISRGEYLSLSQELKLTNKQEKKQYNVKCDD